MVSFCLASVCVYVYSEVSGLYFYVLKYLIIVESFLLFYCFCNFVFVQYLLKGSFHEFYLRCLCLNILDFYVFRVCFFFYTIVSDLKEFYTLGIKWEKHFNRCFGVMLLQIHCKQFPFLRYAERTKIRTKSSWSLKRYYDSIKLLLDYRYRFNNI